MKASALQTLQQRLASLQRSTRNKRFRYAVPSLWLGEKKIRKVGISNPYEFYSTAAKKILREKPVRRKKTTGGEWTSDAVVYNMFVRTTMAFDHNSNGVLDLPVNKQGFRETGTFLKAISLLPYIRNLGANTVHLLPITAIGHDGNKGTLGSPYAIRNPYAIDDNLAEPSLDLGPDIECAAFVEAAHRVGMRVVIEFVFRTASKDSDWVKDHPEWFYWIKEEIEVRSSHQADESRYGSPIFSREELDQIHRDVADHRFGQLLPPHPVYRDFFTVPPAGRDVVLEQGRYVGTLPNGQRVKIPGAFADWPPDDNQPPWGDVTYLRMYEHPDFNYIAYNTIRMYDSRLSAPSSVNRALWDHIVGIIPYYQKKFRIDGVMIDMGHALPAPLKKEMIAQARAMNTDFAFWDENFSITHHSRDEGYNAVFGFLWIDQHHPARMRSFCRKCSTEGFPISFFGTPENHNTPRAASRPGGIPYARWTWVINCFLPAVPFIHSGFELAEGYPINTGLDFTPEQLKHLPSEKLPLFSEYAYDWLRKEEFSGFVAAVAAIRNRFIRAVTNPEPGGFVMLHDPNEYILAFARTASHPDLRIGIVTNMQYRTQEQACVRLETTHDKVTDLLTGRDIPVSGSFLTAKLGPGQCLLFEF
jgi:hypothetical protein